MLKNYLSQEEYEKVTFYIENLLQWNKTINLISRKINKEKLENFILEAIAIKEVLGKAEKILDLGSGNGLPAIILAILGYKVDMVEIRAKKAAFLLKIMSDLNLEGTVYSCDIKNLEEKGWDWITSKALGDAKKIQLLCKNFARGKRVLLCKEGPVKVLLGKEEFSFEVFNLF